MVLGYWDIRGLAHAIRMLLEFTDTSYEEKRYICGEAPDYDRSQWLDVKFKLDLDFPNVGGFGGVGRREGLQVYLFSLHLWLGSI